MKPPIKPNEDDCCNSGCNPCIFDVFERQLQLYNNYKENNTLFNPEENWISQLEYTTFSVCEIIEINKNQKIIKFKKSKPDLHVQVWWNAGDHFLLKYNGSNTPCSRAYTPIKLKKSHSDDFDFMIVIKKYNEGLVSKYLFNLQKGNETLWRGPYGHYKIAPNKYKRIVMIAQGTGIAPFISIIDNILHNEEDMTKIVLFYCCQICDEIWFRNELYGLKSYWNFLYQIHLSNVECLDQDKIMYREPIIQRKLSVIDVLDLKHSNNDQFLVCGSQRFMEEFETHLKKQIPLENIVLF